MAQAAIFFTGGFETSSTAIAFAFYEMAKNQDIQKRLRKEIVDALSETDGKFTYDMVYKYYIHYTLFIAIKKYNFTVPIK